MVRAFSSITLKVFTRGFKSHGGTFLCYSLPIFLAIKDEIHIECVRVNQNLLISGENSAASQETEH